MQFGKCHSVLLAVYKPYEDVAGVSSEIRGQEGLRLEFALGITNKKPPDRHRRYTGTIPHSGATGDLDKTVGSPISETDAVALPGELAILEKSGKLFVGLAFVGGCPRPLGFCGAKSNKLASRRKRVTTRT